jgi:hypothetical protein
MLRNSFCNPSDQIIKKISCLLCLAISFLPAETQNVVTQHNDLKRTGWNPGEKLLTQAGVASGGFGKIFAHTVDDQIYCQPLVVNQVTIGGGVHNIVIVATVNNSVASIFLQPLQMVLTSCMS